MTGVEWGTGLSFAGWGEESAFSLENFGGDCVSSLGLLKTTLDLGVGLSNKATFILSVLEARNPR